jgi:ferritin-like metal-binding protein YciE
MDATKLTATFRELEYVENQASNMLDKLGDEIIAIRDMYGAIMKHRFETEAYIRIYTQHNRCLKEFVENRNKLGGPNNPKKK